MKYAPAKKRFGQHFLEPAWVDKLVKALSPASSDTFLEIGPGRGALTRPLARRVSRVVAVEIDRGLAAALPTALGADNVVVVCDDFLQVDIDHILGTALRPVRVVGNLPYNLSTPILFRLIALAGDGAVFSDATLMLQREVADRLVATPGSSDYGALAVQVALVADVERLLVLPPGAFRPPPAVRSAVVRLRFRPPAFDIGDRKVFETVTRGVFLQRRKMLGNALEPVAHGLGDTAAGMLQRAGIDPQRRPQTLTLAEMVSLARAVL
ncbi:MAG: ribosomal RNA small subunit methyltransferase A [Acidobacteria bacterium]|nr:ribosomal RNA small subunit methyltransferase A [Acidobacteriota bacterium]